MKKAKNTEVAVQGAKENQNFYSVIMAGGKGTRFWPLSREMFPKQYLKLVGDHTLLQQTISRLDGAVAPENVVVVTTDAQKFIVRWQAGELGIDVDTVVEPQGRNTAPAIALITYKLFKKNKDAVLLVQPADHYIKDPERFRHCLGIAMPEAIKGRIVTFGIVPTRPETGYGYIKTGHSVSDGVFHVSKFVEKPSAATAQTYLDEGVYYWNAGIFLFRAKDMVEEFKAHMPAMHKAFTAISAKLNTDGEKEALSGMYGSLEEQSIDYGIMEKSKKVSMVSGDFPWSDIGSWTALDEVMEPDASGNVVEGNVVDLGCENSIFFSQEKLVATIGLKDMVVVDTTDATLIAPKDKVQMVKDLVGMLKKEGKEEYLSPRLEERPWGHFSVLQSGPNFKIKNIGVNPGGRLSMQMHNHRSEHWIVVSGTAKVTRGDEVFYVHQNESTFIPATVRHSLENQGKIPLRIIEIQSGEYLGEDDIIRFDDVYGRSE